MPPKRDGHTLVEVILDPIPGLPQASSNGTRNTRSCDNDPVGTFFHPITVLGETGERITFDALVDTGTTFTSIPREVLLRLGVQVRRQVRLRLADGSSHVQNLGYTMVQVDEYEGPTCVIFAANGSPPTIGAVTLEGFLLGVDPVDQKLVPVEGWQA